MESDEIRDRTKRRPALVLAMIVVAYGTTAPTGNAAGVAAISTRSLFRLARAVCDIHRDVPHFWRGSVAPLQEFEAFAVDICGFSREIPRISPD
ncbi:hypothetical protein [Bradyrhizobium sp. CCGE-LA001]|uniref:hypothetical protein n=1 Tax=Bradyrhizobium sp. CCGE-LA001 TaxID=1223566 RepID=UPI0002AAAE20|nr:hypothetical protein [Bradyrhizobium sp. CCGE-LA001]AMA60931.1 hypothetical protein BCCGELA001_35175 [Bradyrhizobium sp. CCGE-LA001]